VHGFAGFFMGGRFLEKIEAEIREYFGVKHVFLVSSGKAALTLILVALKGLSSKRDVLIPAYTCFSVPSAICRARLNVSLCDIDPTTLDFDFTLLEKSLSERTLCVLPIHLLGLPSDVERVKTLCKDKGVFVVEDAAQAMGGRYNGSLLGTLGDVAFFSLGRGKNLTCGSGGIILTNSDRIAQVLQSEYAKLKIETPLKAAVNIFGVMAMRLLIHPRFYWLPAGLPFLKLGETKFSDAFPMNRLDGLRAGLLLNWQERLDQSNSARRMAAKDLIERLPPRTEVVQSRLHMDPIYLRLPVMMESKEAKEKLCVLSKENGLGITPFYPTSIQAIEELTNHLEKAEFPAGTMVAERLVTLPVHHLLGDRDREKICNTLNELHAVVSVPS